MGITNLDYFDDDIYMSVSRWKKMNKCEVYGIEPWGNTTSSALLIGQYVDAHAEGTLEEFKESHPEIISSRGATKGELKADFKLADEVCAYMDNDSTIQQFLSGEKQTILTGEIGGVPFKIKMDSYSKGIAISDLKVMRTVTDKQGNYYDFITQWGYDYQLACYQEIVRQNDGVQLPCYIVALTKETPINSVVIQIPQHVLDRALYEVESKIEHFYEVKMGRELPNGCGTCGSCISARTETPLISMDDIY